MTHQLEELRGEINILLYELTDSDDVVKELGDRFIQLIAQHNTELLKKLKIELESLEVYDRSLFREGYTDEPKDRRSMWQIENVLSVIEQYERK